MSFSAYETSVEDSSRVQLVEISVGATSYKISSTEEDYSYLGSSYEGVGGFIVSSQLVAIKDRNKTVVMDLPSSHPFIERYVQTLPGRKAIINIFELQKRDGSPPERVLVFKGLVQSVAFTKGSTQSKVAMKPLTGLLSRSGPRATFQSLCNNILFDEYCTVDKDSFKYSGTVASFTSGTNVLEVTGINAAKGGSFAVGGYVTNSDLTDYRMVIAQSGDELTLHFPFPTSFPLVGESVDVFAGCSHTFSACVDDFNNGINFGGCAFVPDKNIFQNGIT